MCLQKPHRASAAWTRPQALQCCEPHLMMGTCSKLGWVQSHVTASPFVQPPILAHQIILSSNYLFLTLDKEEWKWVWGRKVIISMGYGRFAYISLAQRMRNLWVGFVIQSLASAAVLRGCFSHATTQFCSAFIPCSCCYSACSNGKNLPSN